MELISLEGITKAQWAVIPNKQLKAIIMEPNPSLCEQRRIASKINPPHETLITPVIEFSLQTFYYKKDDIPNK